MSGSDDPFFLRLVGPSGREFRLLHAKGKTLRRGTQDVFVLGGPDDPDVNVANPELNSPLLPPLDLAKIERVSLHKGLSPIPNVRGVGELDDRLELELIEVELYTASESKPRRYQRTGPLWLGLNCGLSIELADVDESA
jgi:hypothetical protein